jgi:hypothetical protein
MISFPLILVIIALVCFALAAIGVPSSRFSLGWTGMFLYVLATVVR